MTTKSKKKPAAKRKTVPLPDPVLRVIMHDYVREKIDPMIEFCPELRRRQLRTIGSDNIERKAFLGGMICYFIWPTTCAWPGSWARGTKTSRLRSRRSRT